MDCAQGYGVPWCSFAFHLVRPCRRFLSLNDSHSPIAADWSYDSTLVAEKHGISSFYRSQRLVYLKALISIITIDLSHWEVDIYVTLAMKLDSVKE